MGIFGEIFSLDDRMGIGELDLRFEDAAVFVEPGETGAVILEDMLIDIFSTFDKQINKYKI